MTGKNTIQPRGVISMHILLYLTLAVLIIVLILFVVMIAQTQSLKKKIKTQETNQGVASQNTNTTEKNSVEISNTSPEVEKIPQKAIVSYKPKEVAISFDYPKFWGNITTSTLPGVDKNGNKGNELLLFMLPYGDQNNARFFVANDPLFESEGRGGFWADETKKISEAKGVLGFCDGKTNCTVFQNPNGVSIAKHIDAVEDFAENPRTTTQYFLYSPNGVYVKIGFSELELLDYYTATGRDTDNVAEDLKMLIDSVKLTE